MNREPLQESLCISVTALQSLEGVQNVRSPRCVWSRRPLVESLSDTCLWTCARQGDINRFFKAMMVCGRPVGWLRTATVHTKQTTDCPREDKVPLSFSTLSLPLHPANRQGQRWMQLLLGALTLDGGRTGLDWALPCLLPPNWM